jgi:quinol monooxygenase YgiN
MDERSDLGWDCEGQAGPVERVMREFMPQTQTHPGCLHCTLHRSLDDADTFILIERWASKEHIDKHLQTDLAREYRARTESIMDGRPTMLMFEMLDVDGTDPSKSSF